MQKEVKFIMKLNCKELSRYQEFWQQNEHLSKQHKDGLNSLANILKQRAKDNGDEIDNVFLLYPEDCSDFNTFLDFASIMQAYVLIKDEGGAKMEGWFCNCEVDLI